MLKAGLGRLQRGGTLRFMELELADSLMWAQDAHEFGKFQERRAARSE